MSFQCLDPYVAVSRFTKLDGKRILKIYSKKRLDYDIQSLKRKYGDDNVYVLPCGKCESCRRNKAEDWAIRCELEAKCHKYNYFVTLTYNNDSILFGSDYDFKAFLDRLEGKGHKRKFKYFACREFGELTSRLHWHLVLFCDFPIDLYNPVKIGDYYHYESDLMKSLWKFGFYTISPFETSCARYVAKYTAKNSKLFMSRNIGKTYFLEHYDEIIADNFKVYSDFGQKFVSYVPTCFIRWFDSVNKDITADHKRFKKDLAHLVLCEKRRCNVSDFEEDIITSDQKRIKEKGRKFRKL